MRQGTQPDRSGSTGSTPDYGALGYWGNGGNAAAGGTGSGPYNTRKQPCCYRFRAHFRCSLPHSFASNALSSRASVSMSHHDLPLRMLVTVAGAIPAASATARAVAGTPSRPGHCVSQAQHEISGGCCGCWCVWFERPGRPVAVDAFSWRWAVSSIRHWVNRISAVRHCWQPAHT